MLAAVSIDAGTLAVIITALAVLLGGGGAVGFVRYFRTEGARDARTREANDAVLGTERNPGGLVAAVADIRRSMSTNGQGVLGAIVERIDRTTQKTHDELSEHVGQDNERFAQINRRLDRIDSLGGGK